MADDHPLHRAPTARSNLSRNSAELEAISRIHSGQFLDDNAVYLNDDELEEKAEEEEEGVEEMERRSRRRQRNRREEGEKRNAIGQMGSDNDDDYHSSNDIDIAMDKDLEKGLEKPRTREQEILDPTKETITKDGQIAPPPPPAPTDPKLVCFTGPDDPENPKNWSLKKKWAATAIVSCFTFISPVSSSMVAPSLRAIATQFHITNEVEMELVMSVFILAYAIGPLFLGPFSEVYGRVIVLQIANLFYLAFNIACGVSQSKGQLIAFRFLSGLGGSAPMAVGCPPFTFILTDILKSLHETIFLLTHAYTFLFRSEEVF